MCNCMSCVSLGKNVACARAVGNLDLDLKSSLSWSSSITWFHWFVIGEREREREREREAALTNKCFWRRWYHIQCASDTVNAKPSIALGRKAFSCPGLGLWVSNRRYWMMYGRVCWFEERERERLSKTREGFGCANFVSKGRCTLIQAFFTVYPWVQD
jgi:hypothetical protein